LSGAQPLQAARLCSLETPAKKSAIDATDGFCPAYVVIVQQPVVRQARFKGHCRIMTTPGAEDREQGSAFLPRFDAQGLLTAIAVDSVTRDILMVAYMDAEALAKTRESGLAHFHSRSRGKLWLKGETSGHFLRVAEIRVDCDQDALLLLVRPEGPACHTGAASCFYRTLTGDTLVRNDT
jgi:phosphoribosyl-AMP cyclohydrolase